VVRCGGSSCGRNGPGCTTWGGNQHKRGHLLAIWEQGTKSKVIDEVLVKLGIGGAEQGKLDIAANVGFADAARVVSEADGIAIAAHIDRPRGLLKLQVAAHVKSILLEECLAAVEIVDFATVKTLEQKLGDKRLAACVRGSDMTPDGGSYHCLGAIGHRRTWIKAAVPDLVGIRHALQDPELRIRLKEPPEATHPRIESVEITGGFLDRQKVLFSPDLSCLLGGTVLVILGARSDPLCALSRGGCQFVPEDCPRSGFTDAEYAERFKRGSPYYSQRRTAVSP